MSDFDKWYETYERDGGELLLFNTLDLKASWGASRINLIQEVIELIDGLEGSWADLEYNDVLRDVIKAIVKKYSKEVQGE